MPTIAATAVAPDTFGLSNCGRAIRAGVNDLGSLHFDATEVRPAALNGRTSVTSSALESVILRSGKRPVERHPYVISRPRYTFSAGNVASEPVYIRNF